MKICIRSGTPLGTSPICAPYFESLQRHASRIARAGTIVEFPNLGRNLPGAARSRTHLHFVAQETIRSAMRAQAQGYDVFVTQCLDLSQWLIDQGIREVGGAQIMDPLAIAIKTAETMVDLHAAGITRYRSGAWAVPSQDVRALIAQELGERSA